MPGSHLGEGRRPRLALRCRWVPPRPAWPRGLRAGWLVVWLASWLVVGAATALPLQAATRQPPAELRACVQQAARHHDVSAEVLLAIAWQESRWNSRAIRHNMNGSVDRGAFQINSVHLPALSPYGISQEDLHDPCVGAFVAAWLYARHVQDLGPTWHAVGAYHSRTPALQTRYANGIAQVLAQWGVIAGHSAPAVQQRVRPAPSDR